MQDYSNNALHFAEPDGSLEPTLTPELVAKGFATMEPDDHSLIVTHYGDKIGTFGCNALRELIRQACLDHLQTEYQGVKR